ncbi:MAG: hypothetical protein ACM3TN_21510 [Alphaproteobacteria bacterium]
MPNHSIRSWHLADNPTAPAFVLEQQRTLVGVDDESARSGSLGQDPGHGVQNHVGGFPACRLDRDVGAEQEPDRVAFFPDRLGTVIV